MTDDTLDEFDEAKALAAEYALGLLSPEEARAFEELLNVDPEFRQIYAAWAEDFASLTDDIPEETPSKEVWSRLEGGLFPESKQSLMQRLGLIPAIVGGLLAALLVLVVTDRVGLFGPSGGQPEQAGGALVAEMASETRDLVVLARLESGTSELVVNREAGAAAEGRDLELWLIVGENAPVSLGVLGEGAETRIPLAEDQIAVLDGAVLALSDEPDGGSPTGAPTGDVLAVGNVAAT